MQIDRHADHDIRSRIGEDEPAFFGLHDLHDGDVAEDIDPVPPGLRWRLPIRLRKKQVNPRMKSLTVERQRLSQ